MQDTVLMVLNMLSEGRISVDEASRLIDLYTQAQAPSPDKTRQYHQRRRTSAGKPKEIFDETIHRTTESVENFSKSVSSKFEDVGSKVETSFKELEPKIKQGTKNAISKIADAFEHVAKSLNETTQPSQDRYDDTDVTSQYIDEEFHFDDDSFENPFDDINEDVSESVSDIVDDIEEAIDKIEEELNSDDDLDDEEF